MPVMQILKKSLGKRLAALVVAPLVVVSTLLLLLAFGLHQYPLVVCNEDAGFDMPMAGHLNIPATLAKALDPQVFALSETKTLAEARQLYDQGKVKALIHFPAHLTEDMMIKLDDPTYILPEKLTIEVADANPMARLAVLSAIGRSSLAALQESGSSPSLDSLPIPLDPAALLAGFAPAPTYLLLVLAGFIAWVLSGILALGAALGLRDRRVELAVAALPLALTFVAAFALAGTLLFLGLLAVACLVFGLTFTPAFALASLVVCLLVSAAAALAFAIGLNAPEAEKARAIIPLLILPLFFGGFLVPAELMPVWLQWIKYLLVPYWGLNATAWVGLEQAGQATAWHIAATGLWALGFLVLGAVGLRRDHGAVAVPSSGNGTAQ